MSNESVQVGIVRSGNVQLAATDIVDGIVVDKKCAVGMFDGAVG